MAQVFHHSINTVARGSMVVAAIAVATSGYLVLYTARSPMATRQGEAREQPIPFSHVHHVRGVGLDCRYCHTSVEKGAVAGIPPTSICMNCHSQIWADSPTLEPVRASFRENRPIPWVRVHDLPDFVYFDHSVHVNKGVGCTTCHGRIDKMPLVWQDKTLLMEWCLGCHRAPEKYLRPKEEVFNTSWQPPSDQVERGRALVKAYHVRTRTSCSTCHR
jgi:hypothetical protein